MYFAEKDSLRVFFVEYGITIDDKVSGVRNGGFGSTTENK